LRPHRNHDPCPTRRPSDLAEPVLAGIAARIRAEEVGHYKHFYQYYRRYSQTESPSRWRVLGAIRRRVLEARNSDAEVALWHVYADRKSTRLNSSHEKISYA